MQTTNYYSLWLHSYMYIVETVQLNYIGSLNYTSDLKDFPMQNQCSNTQSIRDTYSSSLSLDTHGKITFKHIGFFSGAGMECKTIT